MRRPRFLSRRPRVSGDKDTVPELSRRQARRAERAIAARDMSPEDTGDVPGWVSQFRRWGVPAAAILVLVLCAPGEQHLGDLAGWGYRMSWGLSGLFTLYAGLAAVISTQLPKGARGKSSSVWGAFLSLALAMAAQPVSHMFVTGYISVEPRPPLWLVVTVSSVPPLILGHLLHFAAMGSAERSKEPSREVKPASRGRVFLEPVPLVGVTGMRISYGEIARSKHSPVVYFVRNGDRVKIGTTQCVTERVSNLSLTPEDILLILHGGRAFERDMHELFAEDRIGTTEWFVLSPALMSFIRARGGQDIHQSPVATVTRLRPRPVPSPGPSVPVLSPVGQSTGQPVSRPSVPAASNVLSLTKGQPTTSPGQTAGQNGLSLSARAEELWLSGWDKDKIRDTLGTEFVSPTGTPPKRNSLNVAVRRAETKHPRP
jgi:hypothetical protein